MSLSHTTSDSVDPQGSAALLVMVKAIERLIATVETELDADSSEGIPSTGSAWIDSCERVLACASESRRVLDRPDVLAALTD
jgi:hypothetical protein